MSAQDFANVINSGRSMSNNKMGNTQNSHQTAMEDLMSHNTDLFRQLSSTKGRLKKSTKTEQTNKSLLDQLQ